MTEWIFLYKKSCKCFHSVYTPFRRLSCDDLAGTASGGGMRNFGATEAEQQLMAEVVR